MYRIIPHASMPTSPAAIPRIGLARVSLTLALLAGCADQPSTVIAARAAADIPPAAYRLRCIANARTLEVDCGAPPDVGTSTVSSDGVVHTFGGQGINVNLVSSGVDRSSTVFAFNVTVQNATTAAMATGDGATRTPDGIRVFINSGPTVTAGSGAMAVINATGTSTFLATNQSYYQYGGSIGGTDQAELGADGLLSTGEVSSAKQWQFSITPSVEAFEFEVYVQTQTPSADAVTAAPQVESVSPETLVPASSAVLTGINFSATPAANTVTIGGVAATVTAASATSLTVTVPCVAGGATAIQVTQGGIRGAAFSHPLAVTQRTVAVGEMVVPTSAADSYCNELTSAAGPARYVVAVYSANTSPNSNSPFQLSGAAGASSSTSRLPFAPPLQPLVAFHGDALQAPLAPARAADQGAHDRHARLLEQNAEIYRTFRSRPPVMRSRQRATVQQDVSLEPPLTKTFRVPNLNVSPICNNYYVVSATRVYYNGKTAIYEDDATPDAFKSSLNATMATNYNDIGDQINADMEPVISTNFGNLLRRDAETDNNGVVIALFTPRINTSLNGVVAFTVSCDQYPNDDSNTPAVGGPYTGSSTNGSSNFGEIVYGYQPVTEGTSLSANTPRNWFRLIRSKLVHELKHIAAFSARVANGAPGVESTWLEEGTAIHAEELWMRNSVDKVTWKGNTGYGSVGNPINIYCDARPGFAECDANPLRPAVIMQPHFASLYTEMFGTNARLLSPFGATASDTQLYYYNVAWSLIRYAIDRYGASDAAFLTALTNATTSGATNLTERAGVSIEQLLAGWAISLYADDFPGLAAPSADIMMPTWNFRTIYSGLNTDFPGTYTLAYPLLPQARSFGTFTPVAVTTLRGGGVLWYELTGTQSAKQLLRLETSGGGQPSTSLRIAISRLQ